MHNPHQPPQLQTNENEVCKQWVEQNSEMGGTPIRSNERNIPSRSCWLSRNGPVHDVCTLSGMLLAVFGIVAVDEDPPRAGTRRMEALEELAIRRVPARRSERLGGDLMKSGLQGTAQEKNRQKDSLIKIDSQESQAIGSARTLRSVQTRMPMRQFINDDGLEPYASRHHSLSDKGPNDPLLTSHS